MANSHNIMFVITGDKNSGKDFCLTGGTIPTPSSINRTSD